MPVYEIHVRGRVQGVGFRYYAKDSALRHGVRGYVRNLVDRSVYIVAEADESYIDSFCELLRLGNGFSRVEALTIEILDTPNRYHDFEIR